jgi:3-hydroxyacyl-CoA dehydrogenase/enoyl-CoA hydratase/3-hydroxybutyryl-CoA epimerase/3-hydroxyacyl-CoA dehydrogenase/enoyl-CoA hydratase/3-hydroxybutyryl-CoA epimerase/enoyl-CoA isomerase
MSSTEQCSVRLEILDGHIGLATLDQPGSRANTLGQALLGELETFFANLAARTDLRGLVFRSGKPGMFIAGADLREMGSIPEDPELKKKVVQRGLNLIARIEALPFPTVAAIDGACVGGGLEFALGFDYRLASPNPKTEIGLPEVKVGLIPGWGGTQRLTRLIGPSNAAELICAGETVKAERARQLGIVFDVVPVDQFVKEAVRLIEFAHSPDQAAQAGAGWREARLRKQQPVGLSEEQLAFTSAVIRAGVLAKAGNHYPAPLAAAQAIIKGCNLPLSEGLKVETDAFVPIVGSRVSRNLIAVFFMGQRLQKDPGVADPSVQARPAELVGVVGAGIMGSGIAGAHVRRGVPTLMLDNAPGAVEKGIAGITKSLAGRVEIGRMAPAEMAGALARLSNSTTLQALADRDVVIEAIIENEEAKVALFASLEKILRQNAVLASNTSTISITRMAKGLARPEQFAGMHFFNPVDRMQLVEVIRGEKTNDVTVATLVALAKKIGKTPIVVRDCPGFLVNRILFPYLNESLVLLQEGATPRAVDKAATSFGMPMGPVTLNDVVGLDTSLYAGRVVNSAFADRAVITGILDALVKAGRLGQKSGSGFYSYVKGSRGIDDPALQAILEKCRTAQREISQEEMTDRLFLPMLTEASRILTEGIVRDPADVDMGLILGIGFPAFRGGLLRWADDEGMGRILEKLRKHEQLGLRFQPTEQMRRLASEGKGFYRA